MIAIGQDELDRAARERERLIGHGPASRAKKPEPRYETWCYCSWCPRSALSTPHYRRGGQCPNPSEYAAGLVT